MAKSNKPRENLTEDRVRRARPESKEVRLYDAKVAALFLRVLPSGIKTWSVTWGRNRVKAIGKWPGVTVEAARVQAAALLVETDTHGAPVAVIEANKPAAEKPITLGEFIVDHFTPWARAHQKQAQATLDALQACFGDLYGRELRAVSGFDIERFKARRKKDGIAPATINRDLDRIRKVYSCAVEWDFVAEHPMRKVKRMKVDNARVRYLSADEEQRLRAALQARETERRASRDRHNAWHAARGSEGHPQWPEDGYIDHVMPLVLLALNTGMRRGELFSLDWRSVNLPLRLVTVEAGNAKSGRTRHIPLNDEATGLLTRWRRQGTGKGLVFPGAGGARLTNINKSWDGITTAAKLTDFTFHDLRHSFASGLVMAGVDLNTVRELLGHADIVMTLRYSHLAPGKLADAVAKLGVAQ